MVPIDIHALDSYDSAHHVDTSEGDTFGKAGTSREYREEEIPRLLLELKRLPLHALMDRIRNPHSN